MRTALVAALVVAASSSASANTIASDGLYARASGDDSTPSPRRIEGRVGLLLGGSDLGDADGFSAGVTSGLGYRIGDVTLRARFDHYRVGDSNDEITEDGIVRRGRGTRIGGAVRYSFANTGDERTSSGLGLDLWGEAGLGLEHVTWRHGGVLDRPSGELAVGFEFDGYGRKHERTNRRRHVGYFMAFRSFLAQGPEMDGPATCGGPCTKATKPSRTDVSMFFEMGLHWGR
ncbi:MAG TPA: hypothetical protein VFQ53_21420 [Kofleriaceae bacterium]|nr:hypothetical protein [Kofleriaceae bacterium]